MMCSWPSTVNFLKYAESNEMVLNCCTCIQGTSQQGPHSRMLMASMSSSMSP